MLQRHFFWRKIVCCGLIVITIWMCFETATQISSSIFSTDNQKDHFLHQFSSVCKDTNLNQSHWNRAKLTMNKGSITRRLLDCPSYTRGLFSRFENNSHPIGFAFSMHHQPGILELFLASSFHPQDSYCFHLDPKAAQSVKVAFQSLIRCYQESFPKTTLILIPDPVPVNWGHFSVLEADLKCMRALKQANTRWKDFINPAATELPVQNMTQVRAKLSLIQESIVDSFPVPYINEFRFAQGIGLFRNGPNEYDCRIANLGYKKAAPPLNITMRKGSKNVALKRDFVDFILNNQTSWTLLNWLQDVGIPDEHFYSTLITLFKGTENGNGQDLDTDHTHGGCVRLSLWGNTRCAGFNVRSICNFGMGDLERLQSEPKCMFANKFNLDVDSLAPICHSLAITNQISPKP